MFSVMFIPFIFNYIFLAFCFGNCEHYLMRVLNVRSKSKAGVYIWHVKIVVLSRINICTEVIIYILFIYIFIYLFVLRQLKNGCHFRLFVGNKYLRIIISISLL